MKPGTRILIVSPMPPAVGGIATSSERLCERLRADGYDVDTYNLQIRNRVVPHSLFQLANMLWFPFYVLARRRYDIIHFHVSGWWRRVFIRFSKPLLKGTKTVMTNHGDVSAYIHRRNAGKVLGCIDRLICVRPGDRAKLPAGLQPRTREIPAFIMPVDIEGLTLPGDIKSFADSLYERGLPMIVHNGSIVTDPTNYDLYGFGDMADLFDRLDERGIGFGALVIVNDSCLDARQNDFLREIMARMSVHKDVKVCVGTNFSLLPLFEMDNCLYVRPTKTDGDSLSVREALALGSPVVASDTAVRPDATVCYDFSKPAESLTDAVEEVLENFAIHKASIKSDGSGFYGEIKAVYDSLMKN